MGARTDAARAEVLARRGELHSEFQQLEATGRAAIDLPARARRAPVKTAGLAAGTAFIVLGGPKRTFGRLRRAVRGPQADLPESMLPAEIESALRALGTDGDRVRGTLEREFASYIRENTKVRRQSSGRDLAIAMVGNFLRPITWRLGWRLAGQLAAPDPTGFQSALEQIRRAAAKSAGAPAPGSSGGSADSASAPGSAKVS